MRRNSQTCVRAALLLACANTATISLAQFSGVTAAPSQSSGEVMHAPYFYADATTTARIRLVNLGAEDDYVGVRAALGGTSWLDLGSFPVPALQHADIPLNGVVPPGAQPGAPGAWGDGSIAGSTWGSLEVHSATGGSLGWVETLAPDKSLVMGSELGFIPPLAELAAVWWKPTAEARVLFALQNASPAELDVDARVLLGGAVVQATPVRIGPGQARLIPLADLAPATLGAPGAGWPASSTWGGSAMICSRPILPQRPRP